MDRILVTKKLTDMRMSELLTHKTGHARSCGFKKYKDTPGVVDSFQAIEKNENRVIYKFFNGIIW